MDDRLCLLVPAGSHADASAAVRLGGEAWRAVAATAEEAPPYTCVSYAWGPGRSPHPTEPRHSISDRALPAIETARRVRNAPAFWIDAFGVPFDAVGRAACLRSLGSIYANSSEVVVVLSGAAAKVIEEVHRQGAVSEASLLMLEADEWVTRVWTYQEIVNSKAVVFAAENGETSVDGSQLLSCVGEAIQGFKARHGFDSFGFAERHPRLHGLEDLVADWLTADYQKRSAYQALSSMNHRVAQQSDDFYYAMAGAISTQPWPMEVADGFDAREWFLTLCEAKGDFSFIYSTGPRSAAAGRAWRPAGPLEPVLPWHTYGDGQPGCSSPASLRLDRMCRMAPGRLDPAARRFVEAWLDDGGSGRTVSELAAESRRRLAQVGFSRGDGFVELPEGLFVPHEPLEADREYEVLAATTLRWAHGAPALLTSRTRGGRHRVASAGVFVGELRGVPTSCELE
jgi:hypothetical protein